MSSQTIMIIRHGEKPDDPVAMWPGPGLTREGAEDKKALVIRGWERAGSWAALFGGGRGGADFPTPTAVFAANPDLTERGEPSQRPFLTVSPLAARLGLTINVEFALGHEPELAKSVLNLSGVALICWEHKAIVADLLSALVEDRDVAGLPQKWDGSRFDVVLRFDRANAAADWKFKQLFPVLLSGDSTVLLE